MPPKASTHFLGFQLAVDSLRAAIVDEQLEIIGADAVEFDTDFPEYQTRGGIYNTHNDVRATSVELWLKAIDLLFERLQQKFDLTKIKAISGSAQHAVVWLTQESSSSLTALHPQRSVWEQLRSSLALPHTLVAQDTSAERYAKQLETLLGGADSTASRVGVSSHSSLLASQIMYVRDAKPDVWANSSRVQLASGFLSSIFIGGYAPITDSEAASSGLFSATKEQWDDAVLQTVAGSSTDTTKVRELLGSIERTSSKPIGTVSNYFTQKYGLGTDVPVFSFTSESLATYLSVCPSTSDCVIDFGPTDFLMTASAKAHTSGLFTTVPHPAQDASEKRKFISIIANRNAEIPRTLVRDMYTKSWSAFDRLVAVVPPGGSIGLDDKLFAFWILQDSGFPFNHAKGVYRFETGVKATEFKDLRANPRCLIESQLLSLRIRLAHLNATGLFLPSRNLKTPKASLAVPSLGISFDPYDIANLPRRVIATGTVATFPSVVGLLGDIFNAPVFIPNSLIESSTISTNGAATTNGETHTPLPPSRAALGSAYMARWGWKRTNRPDEKHASFEDEVRRLVTKKWTVAGNGPATSANRSRSVSAPGPNPGNTFSSLHAKSGLVATSFVEEEEEEESYETSFGQYSGSVTPPRSSKSLLGTTSLSSISGSSAANAFSNSNSPKLANDGAGSPTANGASGGHPPMAPIQPLPTEDADSQMGLVKVADADHDTFLTYAAIVPEYCRLERMLVNGLVQ